MEDLTVTFPVDFKTADGPTVANTSCSNKFKAKPNPTEELSSPSIFFAPGGFFNRSFVSAGLKIAVAAGSRETGLASRSLIVGLEPVAPLEDDLSVAFKEAVTEIPLLPCRGFFRVCSVPALATVASRSIPAALMASGKDSAN